MPLKLVIEKNTNLSSEIYEFFMLRIAGVNDQTLVSEVLSLLLSITYPKKQMILNPIPSDWEPHSEDNRFYALTPNLKLNTLFGKQASFLEQMHFLNVMGLTDKIERRPDLRPAVEFFNFQKDLLKQGIINPEIPFASEAELPIKRIHLVHPEYLDDPEISAGLHVSTRKNRADNQVFYVCNIESLRMALSLCQDNSTLIIDGHWQHGYAIDYGVWTGKNASQISEDIETLIQEFPGKIAYIRLLGCHSGKLTEQDKLISRHQEQHFIFKDRVLEGFSALEMSLFRNRAVYLSQDGESPFDENSLAGKIYEKIKDTSIRLTAPPALTYPYPSNVTVSRFNIGADSEDWLLPPSWETVQSADLPWNLKLLCLKSLTVIKASEAAHEINPETHWLIKR